MVNLEINFSKYDYFGIIIPGFVFLLFLIFIFPIEFFINIGNIISSFGNFGFAFVFLISVGIIIISYLFGLIISGIGYSLIEGLIIEKKLKYPSYYLFQTKNKDTSKNEVDSNNENNSSKLFKRYRRNYSKEFIDNFNEAFNAYFKEDNYNDTDRFKLCFHVVKEKSPMAFSRLTTFISLYGLYRNLTITFIIGTFLLLYKLVISLNFLLILLIICICLLSLFSFNNFLKFFSVYADEVFRSFYIYALEK